MTSLFYLAMFCHCCYEGCDCGCVEVCGLKYHREAAASVLPPGATPEEAS